MLTTTKNANSLGSHTQRLSSQINSRKKVSSKRPSPRCFATWRMAVKIQILVVSWSLTSKRNSNTQARCVRALASLQKKVIWSSNLQFLRATQFSIRLTPNHRAGAAKAARQWALHIQLERLHRLLKKTSLARFSHHSLMVLVEVRCSNENGKLPTTKRSTQLMNRLRTSLNM